MQVYAPRDPLSEFYAGDLSLRKLRVMIEHLPPGSAWHRARSGPWTDTEFLLHDIDSRLREVVVGVQNAAVAIVSTLAGKHAGSPAPPPKFLPLPPAPPVDDVEDVAAAAGGEQHKAELASMVHRRG